MPSILKRIRDLERVLKKKAGDEHAEARGVLEGKLAEMRSLKERNELQEKEKKLSTKYHMIKFVERKKITRKIRVVDTKLKGNMNDNDRARLEESRLSLEGDLTYVMYYPKGKKYIALFADNDDEKNTKKASGSTAHEEARSEAMKARTEAKENNDTDKVQHAINVEYGIETEQAEGGTGGDFGANKFAPTKSIPSKINANKSSDVVKPDVKSSSSNTTTTTTTNNSLNIFGGSTEKKKVSAAKIANSDSDSSSESSSSSSSSSSDDDGDGDGNDKTSGAKRGRGSIDGAKTTENATEKPKKAAKPEPSRSHDLDPFFMEEADSRGLIEIESGDLGGNCDDATEGKKASTSVVNANKTKSGSNNNNQKNNGGKPVQNNNNKGGRSVGNSNKPVHKQEARLLKWQTDRKNRAHVPTLSLRAVRSAEGRDDGGDDNKNGKHAGSAGGKCVCVDRVVYCW